VSTLFSLVDAIERHEIGLAATALNDVLVLTGMAEFPLRGLNATVNLVGGVGATARQTAAQLDWVEDADEGRHQGGGEARVRSRLGPDSCSALNVDV
jgi:hypothetical protein